MKERIQSYTEFYTYYLTQHQKVGTRILHFAGTLVILFVLAYVISTGKERFLWYIPIVGYGLPLLSHFVFERNLPTFYNYPLWTLGADLQYFLELIRGKQKFIIKS